MWLQVGDERHPFADLLDVFDRERHVGFSGDRQQVQEHVGRAAHGIGGGDGVFERLHGHDVAGSKPGFECGDESVDGRPDLAQDIVVQVAGGIDVGWMRRAHGQHHAHCFGDGADRVCGEHGAAGTTAGHDVGLDTQQLIRGDAAGSFGGASLGVVQDREVVALRCPRLEVDTSGRTRAGVDHDADIVGAGQRHHCRGANLVAARDHDECFGMMGAMS